MRPVHFIDVLYEHIMIIVHFIEKAPYEHINGNSVIFNIIVRDID